MSSPVRAAKARVADVAPPAAARAARREAPRPSVAGRAGNQALQRHLKSGALRPKLSIGSVSDPAEHDADRVADAIMTGGKAGPCACGGDCPSCKATSATLRRKPADGAAPATGDGKAHADAFGSSAGRGLDAGARAFFEPHFGDLSHVRLHDGPEAASTAAAISARAYTVGSNIGFARGELRAGSREGRHLLAHELAHVAQGGETVRRQPAPASSGVTVPRPPGLPLEGGYSLQPVPPGLIDVESLPEGQMVDASKAFGDAAAPGALALSDIDWSPADGFGGDLLMGGLQGTGGAGGGLLATSAWQLSNFGFRAAGTDAIGMVMFPQIGSAGHPFPFLQSRVAWGHTAIYVRQGGKITVLRSYTPKSLLGSAVDYVTDRPAYDALKAGEAGTPATVRSGSYVPRRGAPMWTPGAKSIEWPINADAAADFAKGMPDVGPVPGGQYTGVPSIKGGGCGVNCVAWAAPKVEDALGGNFGPMQDGSATSISDIGSKGAPGGSPGQASQGRAYGWTGKQGGPNGRSIVGWDNRTGARVTATIGQDGEVAVSGLPKNALGPGIVGEMTTGMKVLRWGGRAFFVIGVAATVAEIAMAPEDQRERTAVGGIAGFAGGFAAGAVAGLACGPGAPVCSLVLGLGFGFLGGAASRGLAEMIYDQHHHGPGHSATTAELYEFNDAWAKGTECPNCHTSVADRKPFGSTLKFDNAGFSPISPDWFDQPKPAEPRQVQLTEAEMAEVLAFVEGQPQEIGPPAP